MTRRCSHCSNNGHNSRTCPTTKGVKLFGVRLTDGGSIIKKSASVGNLSHYYSSPSSSASPNSPPCDPVPVTDGYVSDDPAHTSCSSNCRGGAAGGGGGSALDRKKGNAFSVGIWSVFLNEYALWLLLYVYVWFKQLFLNSVCEIEVTRLLDAMFLLKACSNDLCKWKKYS